MHIENNMFNVEMEDWGSRWDDELMDKYVKNWVHGDPSKLYSIIELKLK